MRWLMLVLLLAACSSPTEPEAGGGEQQKGHCEVVQPWIPGTDPSVACTPILTKPPNAGPRDRRKRP